MADVHKRLPALFCAVLLSGALIATARAESATTLAAKLAQAAADVRSFVVELHVTGATDVNGSLTFVRPLRVRSNIAVGSVAVETYLIDQTVYIYSPYAGWQKVAADNLHASPQSMDLAQTLASAHLTVLPDREENGRRLGAFLADIAVPGFTGAAGSSDGPPSSTATSATTPPTASPAAPQRLECTYDKATYRLASCSTSTMTMTYEKYNDPANIVELPADAASAVPVVVPSSPPADTAAGSPAPRTPEHPASPVAQPASTPETPQRGTPPHA